MKILIINSFPEYMQVKPEDIEYIESDLSGTATVVSLNDLSDEHVNEKYDAIVSFNCVNIFHPEISKLQINADKLAKIINDIKLENRAIYQRDRYFNGRDVLPMCQFGRMLRTHKIRVLISIPCFERICKETLKSIYTLIIPDNVEADFNYQAGYTVVQARNRQVRESLLGGYDYTLYVDSDVVLPQNLLIHLLRANADLATGWYIKKIPNGPKITEIYAKKRFNDELENIMEEELIKWGGKIVPIGGCGFGCTLVKNSVFEDLKEFEDNWFEYVETKKDGKFYICSEDIKFCERLREKGKTLVCDPTLRCFHVGQMLF
ncbi:MAG: hypothetical protein IKL37_03655 [Alphaproteobacteria bacterium]|nr:hypothetical protein [Alphaproteobacteria bacterium]MBR6685335.1 hypothetical protein [Alphaproteobacteria bacterium]